MSDHFHLGIEHLALGAIGIAVMFHIFRILAAFVSRLNSTAGSALGGFFTFGGAA